MDKPAKFIALGQWSLMSIGDKLGGYVCRKQYLMVGNMLPDMNIHWHCVNENKFNIGWNRFIESFQFIMYSQ